MVRKILVVGSLNMDMFVNLRSLPRKGETIMAETAVHFPGGKGVNQACAVARLSREPEKSKIMGVVGRDTLGEGIINCLACDGVDVSHILQHPKAGTGMSMIYVDDRGQNCSVSIQAANNGCNKDYIQKNAEAFADIDILLIQMGIPDDATYEAIKLAKHWGATIIVNPAPAKGIIPEEICKKADFIIPNETELNRITGRSTETVEEIEDAAKILLNTGVGCVIVTMGEKGVMLLERNALARTISAYDVLVRDTTGAGDTFCGAFAVALSEKRNIIDAVNFANAAAAIAVTRVGAQASVPMRDEVDDFMLTSLF